MKYAFCPVHDFYRRRGKPLRDTDRIHRLYTRAYVSVTLLGRKLPPLKSAVRKAKIAVQTLVWPPVCVFAALRYTLRYGPRVRQACGKTLTRQFLEQLRVGIAEAVPPRSYYLYSMFKPERLPLAPFFVHYHENNYLGARLVAFRERQLLDNKLRFHEFCLEQQLATPPVLCWFRAGRQEGTTELPAQDLIIKPLDGYSGSRIERWIWQGDGHYASAGKVRLDRAALWDHLCRLSHEGPMLVQPRLRNHHAIAELSMGTLCTARLITSRSPGRDATFVAAIMRMGVGDAVVDNFGANGIACPIEGQCGVLSGPAVRWTLLSPGQDRHPDTGVRLEGLKLPDWDAAVRLCLRAHGGLSTCPAVGWDVAFTPDGPVLMEGNMPFGIELTQFVTGLPLLTTTFMTAYLDAESHSRGALATERTDSAIRS